MLARSYPGDEHLRALAIEHWQPGRASPRQTAEHDINIPLSPREQSVREASLPRELRDALNGASRADARNRRTTQARPARLVTAHLAPLSETTDVRRAHGVTGVRKRSG